MTSGGSDRETGSALIATLGIAAFLAALAVLVIQMRLETAQLAHAHRVAIEHETLVDRAFARALWRLQEDGVTVRYGEAFRLEIDGEQVVAEFFSPAGLIDINYAPPQVLGPVLLAAGAADPAALTGAILDWRDEDDLESLNGAERNAYSVLGVEGPANHPFTDPAELQHVLGMTPSVLGCLIENITVSSLSAAPDLAVAPDWVRRAMLPGRAPADRTSVPVAVGAGDLVGLKLTILDGPQDGLRTRVLVRFTGIRSDPYWIQAWDQYAPAARTCEGRA